MAKDTFFCPKKTLQSQGKIINLSRPQVMGILNITADSFYDGGKYLVLLQLIRHVAEMLEEGAAIVDIGAASTRPGARLLSSREEQERLMPALKALVKEFPSAIWSVDTYNSATAWAAWQEGAHIINDISAGTFDPEMFQVIARMRAPYVMMHIKGRPENMQKNPEYDNVLREVTAYFSEKILVLRSMGVCDIIIDPGFGFGKTVSHNYQLLQGLDYLQIFELPVMAGLSRKSMINSILKITPAQALNGTTALNMLALNKGASILRVHDVRQAVEAVRLFMAYSKPIEDQTAYMKIR